MAFLTPVPLRVAVQGQSRAKCCTRLARLAPFSHRRPGFSPGRATPPPPEPPQVSAAAASSQGGATAVVDTPPAADPAPSAAESLFACVSCGAALPAAPGSGNCASCGAPYRDLGGYVDFRKPEPSDPLSTLARLARTAPTQALFETGPVAFAYERGWRRQFARAGFPGPEEEARLALAHVGRTGSLLDVSCATGIFTRAVIAAGAFDTVFGLDASSAMLSEAAERDKTGAFRRVRADVAAMPFREAAFDAVVSGAALHCWPFVQDGLAEVYRVLKPGRPFFATTFLIGAYLPHVGFGLPNVNAKKLYRFFDKHELVWLCKAAGFSSVEVEALRGCAVVRCVK